MSRGNPAQADVLDLFRQETEAQAQVLTAGLLALERTQTAPDPHHAHVDPSGSRDARAERFRISVCAPPIDTPDGTLSVTISVGGGGDEWCGRWRGALATRGRSTLPGETCGRKPD